MNKKMILKSIAIAFLMVIGVTAANAQSGTGGLSDTSKICAGQQLTLKGPTATAGVTYTYEWKNGAGAVVGTDSTLVLTGNANTTNAPTLTTYTLTVTQTGGASCPSNVYTKVLVIYPHLAVTATPASPFYCLGSPTNIVITATTTANGTAPTTANGYGGLVYTWTPGTTPAAPAGTAAANVYTVASANFPTTAGTYTYNASVTYAQTLVGTTAGMAACTASSTANVVINNAPTVNSTTVTTTYQ